MIHFLNDFQAERITVTLLGKQWRNVTKCGKFPKGGGVGVSTENQQVQGTCVNAENESWKFCVWDLAKSWSILFKA